MIAKGIIKHISHISVLLLIYNGEKFIRRKITPLLSLFEGKISSTYI